MNLALTVVNVTAPVFLLAAIGFVWARTKADYPIQFITRLAMSIAVPCLVFTSLMQTEVAPEALSRLLWATLATYGAVTAAMWGVVLVARLDSRTFLAPLIMGNTGNLGLPLALFAFGDEGLSLAIVVFAVMAIYSFTIGVWMVSRSSNPLTLVKEPMVAATVLGALFMVMGWQTPLVLTRSLELVGDMAIPMMLITLGVAVGRIEGVKVSRALVLSVIKAVVCAGLAWAIGLWFDLPPIALGVLVLQVGTPVAVTNYLLAEKYGADASSVAGLVVVSTFLSILVLPLLLSFHL